METSLEVGKKLVEFCKQGKNLDAVEKLYSPDIVSIEAMSMPNFPSQAKGIDEIRKKNQWWLDHHQINSVEAHGPFPLGDRFVVHFKYDTVNKDTQQREQGEEVGLYTVRDGKIVKEEFFYSM
ncbi:nuclear transport factor 2 family protein [Bdellovibrio sp. 22V]|uniref:nuclear transport factor 2 family protein n=1 Tax=Bdellovibrio TaxID=958 RepID=UPI0025427A51|nr:nuclear transport factor 2 family protein [Bdellovibrio sp. 22V]WII71231.1 nuclear transport factor 2 family protein [Bdellovibrio sp. 22V]